MSEEYATNKNKEKKDMNRSGEKENAQGKE